jgi:hypothetical protein
MESRNLKVRSGYYYQIPKHVSTPVPVPFILLKGYWLETYNFEIGNKVSVQTATDQFILRVSNS